jgi:hypothetical protein
MQVSARPVVQGSAPHRQVPQAGEVTRDVLASVFHVPGSVFNLLQDAVMTPKTFVPVMSQATRIQGFAF